MNIFLVPYTWVRHVAPALVVAGAAVITWWALLWTSVSLGPTLYDMGVLWRPWFDGFLLLVFTGTVIGTTSVMVEGSLRRRPLLRRVGMAALSGLLTFLLAAMAYLIAWFLGLGVVTIVAGDMAPIYSDTSVVSIAFRGVLWGAVGLGTGLGPYVVRQVVALVVNWLVRRRAEKLKAAGVEEQPEGEDDEVAQAAAVAGAVEITTGGGFVSHVLGGLGAASLGAAVWDGVGYYGFLQSFGVIPQDLYLAPALGVFTWGFLYGALTWGIPPELYAGWIRVLSRYRYGHRLPVDRPDGKPSERFVGHYPRGLDLFLPAENGVAELHTSFVVDADRRYAVRGLSVQRTVVRRFLEKVKIHYNPHSPAPLETPLEMEDRVILSDGANETVLEFILLPKEER